jgi:hypothetical protein
VGLLAPESDLDYALLIFHQQPYGLPTKLPYLGEFSDAIVTLKRWLFGYHGI